MLVSAKFLKMSEKSPKLISPFNIKKNSMGVALRFSPKKHAEKGSRPNFKGPSIFRVEHVHFKYELQIITKIQSFFYLINSNNYCHWLCSYSHHQCRKLLTLSQKNNDISFPLMRQIWIYFELNENWVQCSMR